MDIGGDGNAVGQGRKDEYMSNKDSNGHGIGDGIKYPDDPQMQSYTSDNVFYGETESDLLNDDKDVSVKEILNDDVKARCQSDPGIQEETTADVHVGHSAINPAISTQSLQSNMSHNPTPKSSNYTVNIPRDNIESSINSGNADTPDSHLCLTDPSGVRNTVLDFRTKNLHSNDIEATDGDSKSKVVRQTGAVRFRDQQLNDDEDDYRVSSSERSHSYHGDTQHFRSHRSRPKTKTNKIKPIQALDYHGRAIKIKFPPPRIIRRSKSLDESRLGKRSRSRHRYARLHSENRAQSESEDDLEVPDGPRGYVIPPYISEESSSESDESDDSSTFSFSTLSRRQKLLLIMMFLANVVAFMCMGLPAPFFPTEASDKGLSKTVSGWIFGIFALAQFVVSPVFGKLLPVIGTRFLLLSGEFLGGGCTILFGVLHFVPQYMRIEYIVLCFVCRVIMAIGCAACTTATYAITALEFSDSIATVFGILETGVGVGLMIGPGIGGLLFDAGGFWLPFAVVGGLMILCVPFSFYILPSQTEQDNMDESGSFLAFIKIPSLMLVWLSVVLSSFVWSIFDPILAPHLTQFDLSPSMLGLIFLLLSAFYGIFSPIWGWLTDRIDKYNNILPLLSIGFLVAAGALLLIGPTPIIPFLSGYSELWLNLVALSVLGITISLTMVPTFQYMLEAATDKGIPENIQMYGVCGGLLNAAEALGDFSGPVLGGLITDKVGFPLCMTYTAYMCAIMAFVLMLLWGWQSKCGPCVNKPSSAKEHSKLKVEVNSDNSLSTSHADERSSLLRDVAGIERQQYYGTA
ncbi:unnamed protein product [Owenia fusiformis]|uniref:Major facilitator superfamily (MFS) profile domain-containing protein n=1 Tax=Owenia fusiformis TaxID=6347 RepID=A0A8S4N106_OWEFU|nr:unnamed protein product [Owenia fusiformis]